MTRSTGGVFDEPRKTKEDALIEELRRKYPDVSIRNATPEEPAQPRGAPWWPRLFGG